MKDAKIEKSVVDAFKAKTNELFHEIDGITPSEIEEIVKNYVQEKFDRYGVAAAIVGLAVIGSRCRGLEKAGADLDVVIEFSTEEREDDLFQMLNYDDPLYIGDVVVDMNPITACKTGTLASYLLQAEKYLAEDYEAKGQQPKSIFSIRMEDSSRYFENTSGLGVEALCRAYAGCGKPFVEMGQFGRWISEADFAYLQQSDGLLFSVEFDAENDKITIISDGENLETKGLTETLFPQKAGKGWEAAGKHEPPARMDCFL